MFFLLRYHSRPSQTCSVLLSHSYVQTWKQTLYRGARDVPLAALRSNFYWSSIFAATSWLSLKAAVGAPFPIGPRLAAIDKDSTRVSQVDASAEVHCSQAHHLTTYSERTSQKTAMGMENRTRGERALLTPIRRLRRLRRFIFDHHLRGAG